METDRRTEEGKPSGNTDPTKAKRDTGYSFLVAPATPTKALSLRGDGGGFQGICTSPAKENLLPKQSTSRVPSPSEPLRLKMSIWSMWDPCVRKPLKPTLPQYTGGQEAQQQVVHKPTASRSRSRRPWKPTSDPAPRSPRQQEGGRALSPTCRVTTGREPEGAWRCPARPRPSGRRLQGGRDSSPRRIPLLTLRKLKNPFL